MAGPPEVDSDQSKWNSSKAIESLLSRGDDILEHYGVKGMKWGIRKDRNSKTGGRPRGKIYSDDAKRASKTAKKQRSHGIKSLSNKEIEQFNNRMRLEMQYNALKPKSSLAKGQSFVKEALGFGRTANEAMAFANSPAGQSMQEGFKKAASKAR